MTVEEKKEQAKFLKESLMNRILMCQSANEYTMEDLRGKTLAQLERIWDKIKHQQ